MTDPQDRVEELKARLRQEGYRLTPQRPALLRVLSASDGHPSAGYLHEEIQHESWFSEFLGEGPSEHFMRSGETSPFVRKFLE
jgi:hypothetical protein